MDMLCFLQGNIALFKTTDQNSTFQSSFSSYAVDGGNGTDYRVCAHTGDPGNTNPFWRVDLGRVEHVAEVRILNRDCCAAQLDGAEIRVGQWFKNNCKCTQNKEKANLYNCLYPYTTCK